MHPHLRHTFLFFLIVVFFLVSSCSNDKEDNTIQQQITAACYPYDVGKIFVTKCATAGCHNTQSKDGAAGFDMSTWENLFKGANGGSAVIPYRADQSFLVNFINTYSDLGTSQEPIMPNNGTPLTREEVQTVINWINDGAPNCSGARLTDNPDRKKFYITNQGCDLVSVWDADKKVIMRYITVGGNPNVIESPHSVRISPDGKFWYLSFVANGANKFQKYRTSDDTFVGEVDITVGSWNTFAFTSDSRWAYIIDYNNPGRVAIVDCDNMTLKAQTPFNPDPGNFASPHGSVISPDGNYLYITMQAGNALYKMDITSFPPDGHYVNFPGTVISKPHEVAFSPDNTLYFVTCEGSNDIKVFRTSDDAFLKSIPVAPDPVEMSFSLSTHNMFVSCMAGNSVSVIDYVDTSFVKTITGFFVPHGIAVDDAHGVCYVVNRNLDTGGGPPPHHTSVCGGRNGYLQEIDLNTLNIVLGFKPELSVDPYYISIRK